MKFLLTLLAIAFARQVAWFTEPEYEHHFAQFVEKHNKNYTTAYEWAHRYEQFKENLDVINQHNAKGLSWKMGISRFADMSPFEFTTFIKRQNGGGYIHVNNKTKSKLHYKKIGASCTEKDWELLGAVTQVKNQGQCGSCWSFSTTGAVEGRSQISTGTLVSLSEQELVSCDQVDSACNGGLMDYAFEYVMENGGLASEDDYPYTSDMGTVAKCKATSDETRYGKISSYQDVATDRDSLEAALCEGPVAIAIEADQSAFQFYESGVMDGTCGTQLDHGVLLVGFGTDETSGQKYWRIKNSWDTTWGDNGYIRICRDCNKNGADSGQCGILSSASFPIV